MTGTQGALIVWAAGAAPAAVYLYRLAMRFLRRDPLLMCDDCRQQRRQGHWIFMAGDPRARVLVPVVIVFVSLLWPIAAPRRLYKHLRGKLHRCNRAEERAAMGTA